MATIINDRDIILQATSPRLNVVSTDYLSFFSSAPGFSIDGTVVTPTTITISFVLNGRLVGTPTISYSGVSSVTTTVVSSTLTTVTFAYSNVTGTNVVISASLSFLGNIYSTSASVSGTNINPLPVSSFNTTTVESLLLRLSWPKNSEIDIVGYEVRDTNTNWGLDNLYLYRGSVTSCTVAPGALGVAKTYYIRAYDATNLFSTSSTSTTYTVVAPSAPTGLSATFSTSSATTSTATLVWNNTVPLFGLKQYKVRITLPNATVIDKIVTTPNIVIDATWSGNATAVVFVTDILGNESLGSTSYVLSKLTPGTITLPATPASPVGTKLLLDWNEAPRTSLPIVSYEVRATNTNWGDGSTYLWKGAVSECQVASGVLNTLTSYYVKGIDSDNVYSTNATAITYTRLPPPTVSDVTYIYSTSTVGQANVTFNWARPAGETYALQLYRLTLTKPGPVVVTSDVYANSWTVNADWEGAATLTVQTLDILNTVSTSTFTKSIIKVPTSTTSTTFTTTPTGNTLVLAWVPSTVKTLRAWSRTTTTATITDTAHGYVTGTTVSITASSDITAIPLGSYVITVLTVNTYTITCLNAGGATGTISDSTASSLPTTLYEIRASNNTTVIYKGSSLNYAVQVNNIAVGANTWYLYAIDSAGKYGNSKALTYSYVVLSNITSISGYPSFTSNNTALFKWDAPSVGSFEASEYSLALSAAAFTTITAVRSTTDWEVPVGWTNSTATLTITPKDVMGTVGTPSVFTLTNTLASTPGTMTPTLRGTDLELDWSDNVINYSTQLPIGWYELRDSTNKLVWKGSNSWASISLVGLTPSQNTWNLYAYDANGYPCVTPQPYTYTLLANPAPVTNPVSSFGTNISDSLLTISWDPQLPRFGLKHYKVVYQDNSTTITATVLSNTINISPIPKNASNTVWTGDKNFTISVVDLLGNESTTVVKVVTKNAPGIVSNYNAQSIDNNVLLSWTLPVRTTLPIDTVRLKKGDTWSTATSIGDKTGTFTTILERAGGTYTYRIAAVDTDGVEGPETAISVAVAQPPDYVFNGEQFSTFTGTKVNALVDQGTLMLPVDLTSTWTQHYTANAWATPDAQIAAGYPVYIQPTLTSGSYQETFDFGATLSSTKITVNILGSTVAGIVSINTTIDTSVDNITWMPTPYTGTSMFASNFRYVKVLIMVAQADGGHGTYRISSLNVTLDSKQKSDSNTVVMSLGGAEPQGNIGPDYVSLWKAGSLPASGFPYIGNASESSITYSPGPGGYYQNIYNCIDNDIASDAEGGWLATYFTADLTKGHLFAVFMKTTSNNGTSYWGTAQDNSIADLSGTVNSNPYFWSADLPTLDTWYLVVGYVHEIGYGTTDTNISGIYNLSGTRVAAGIEFKAVSGTTLAHRCFAYYNVTASGAVVQSMAKPFVIPCTVSNAPTMINYILQCGTGYGMSVTPNNTFIDIISITCTPQGTTPTTPLVDFVDIPNPKRFNIFNYNSSGSLVGGTVSWAVKGY